MVPIRARLTRLVLASILPAALLTAGLITYNYQRERAELLGGTIGTARALAGVLDQRVLELQTGLAVLGTAPSLHAPDKAAFYGRAQNVARTLQVTSIGLLNPSGELVLSTLQPLGHPLARPRPDPPIAQVFTGGKPVLSDLMTGVETRQPAILVGVPALLRDQVAYALIGVLEPRQLRELLVRQKLPPSWIVGILDSQSRVVARSHDQDKYVGVKARDDLIAHIASQPEGSLETRTVDGTPVVTVYSRAPHSRWTVAIGIPKEELTGSVQKSWLLLLAGTSALLALGLGLAGVQARAITRSIHSLMGQANALGRGLPAPRPAVEFREARLLGEAIEDAAAKLEAALARSEGRLQAILESAMDAILAVDDDNRVVVFNAAAAALFGYTPAQALGMPLSQLLPEADPEQPATWLKNRTAAAEAPEQPPQARRHDGSLFPVEAAVSSVQQDGTTFHTIILRDITERLRTRQALLRSNQELQQFAFVASHDLRAPLRSIQGYLSLFQERHMAGQDAAAQDLVHRAVNSARQLDGLTNDLLTYARLDTQSRPMAPLDCNELLVDVLTLLDATVKEAGARIQVLPLPTVHGDRSQMVQLFQNLLGNALKYRGGRAPEITVSAERGQREWIFSVADNGIGIEPRYTKRIFEIFKRLHSQQEYPGNGIGLAVCMRVVQNHGGRMWVTSEPGQGSTFHFSHPDSEEQP